MSDKIWGDAAEVGHWWDDDGKTLVIEHREAGIHSSSEDWQMTIQFALRLYEELSVALNGEE